ncbi:MAG: hypothetical protein C4344_00280, partial [Acidimicrobiia bacterium]
MTPRIVSSPSTAQRFVYLGVQPIPGTFGDVEAELEKLVDDERITPFGMLLEAHGALSAALAHEPESECGIPASWYGVLVRLARSPGGRLRMSELAAGVSLTTSGTTRLVDRIEAAGLI